MVNQADIKAVITAEDKASSTLKKFGNNVESVGSKVLGIAKVAAVGLAATGAAATALGIKAVKAFEDSENRIAQTNAVLASTKGVAGVTADAVDKLSKSLQKQTTYSDEDVRSVENLLLTFTAINKDIFPQATKTVLNMATALGEDTKSASIQLGKALQDPILGITALRRVGVNFSDAQKDVIKNMVETGHKADAQKAILKELETEFGNSAEAARHTFGGSLKALKNQLNDVEEKIGETITRSLQPFIQKAADALASIDWEKVIARTKLALKDFATELANLWSWFIKIYQQVQTYLQPKLEALWHSLQDAFPVFRQFIDQYINPLLQILASAAGKSLVWALGFVIDTLNLLLRMATPVFKFLDDNKVVVQILAGAFGALATSMALGAAFDALKVGFATLQLVTIPSMMASLAQLGAAFVAAVPVAAILGELALITVKALDTINTLRNTDQQIKASTDSQVNAVQQLIAMTKAPNTPAVIARSRATLHAMGIKGYASGVENFEGGLAYVHKDEVLVNMPKGTDVIPKDKLSTGSGAANHFNININAQAFMGSQIEARKFAKQILDSMNDLAGKHNTTPVKLMGG